jgi:Inorganic Pyrophosphatase
VEAASYWKLSKGKHNVVRHLTFQGMQVAVETDKGQERHWLDSHTGEQGTTKMRYPYGYFVGTRSSGVSGDGMALDVYVGPEEDADDVYVVRQMKKPSFKDFDELKVMVGFESEKQARVAYLAHYNDERFLGSIESHSLSAFKQKFMDGVQKALPEEQVLAGQAPRGVAGPGMSPEGFVNPAGVGPTGMGMNPMMAMMPPAIDVETLDGVKSLLRRLGGMKDEELMKVGEEIWGPGYQFVDTLPGQARAEVAGFLLDQRDLLELAEETLAPGPPALPQVTSQSPSVSQAV